MGPERVHAESFALRQALTELQDQERMLAEHLEMARIPDLRSLERLRKVRGEINLLVTLLESLDE